MPLGTFICRDFSVLLVRPTEALRTCSTNEGGAQKHQRLKRPHAPSVRMFPGTLMGAEARDGYGPMSKTNKSAWGTISAARVNHQICSCEPLALLL